MEKVDIISRFFTSLFVAGISTVLAVVLYSMAGYVLARTDFKGKKIIFMLLISSMLIPSNAMVQPVLSISLGCTIRRQDLSLFIPDSAWRSACS